MAKIQPIITSRKIKDELKLHVSAVTVRRRLIETISKKPPKSTILEKKIIVWGCFSYSVGAIYRLWISLNTLKWVFQQDNNPKHTSKRATSWFQTKMIQVMQGPAQSPDPNPIENLWGDIKNAVSEAKPKNSQELSNRFQVPKVG